LASDAIGLSDEDEDEDEGPTPCVMSTEELRGKSVKELKNIIEVSPSAIDHQYIMLLKKSLRHIN